VPIAGEVIFIHEELDRYMTGQNELQRKNQELIRQNRRLERELQKKEKALAA